MKQPPSEANTNKPKLSFITTFIGSGFFSGYSPFISGTVGSAVALLFFLIPTFPDPFTIIPSTVILFFAGGLAAEKMEMVYGQDPAIVTIDEVVGMLVSLWFIPPTLINISVAFIIFRILDILKPYPAHLFDRKSGGWNIMLDDVVAGIYTNIILQIALHWF